MNDLKTRLASFACLGIALAGCAGPLSSGASLEEISDDTVSVLYIDAYHGNETGRFGPYDAAYRKQEAEVTEAARRGCASIGKKLGPQLDDLPFAGRGLQNLAIPFQKQRRVFACV